MKSEEYLEDLMYQASSEIANAIMEYYPETDLQDEITSIIYEHTSDGYIGISYAVSDIISEIESCTGECPDELIAEIENIMNLWSLK